jgi:type II secretory pathway pseudopilin PulG
MKTPAITFLEIVLVIGIFMILMSATVPQIARQFFSNELEVGAQELVKNLRKAQAQATTQVRDSSWGLHLDTAADTYTIFAGDDYASRVLGLDLEVSLPSSVGFQSVTFTDVIFDQVTGATSNPGDIILDSESESETRTITVNALGNVESN